MQGHLTRTQALLVMVACLLLTFYSCAWGHAEHCELDAGERVNSAKTPTHVNAIGALVNTPVKQLF